MIVIIDYGLGNLRSVQCALRRIGAESTITSDAGEASAADGVILPGVGAFWRAMENLRKLGLAEVVLESVRNGKPLLGICLGMQLLFSESEEHGRHEGLGIIPGKVKRFTESLKIPHMGWNEVRQQNPSPLLIGVKDEAFFYFAHSYYVAPDEPAAVIGLTDYGKTFASVVRKDNVFGTQFHPERSGPEGLEMLKNFYRLCQTK
ncbi:MAG: imidazole glycerol phosphate synthase subunit HisH [Planctomycetota bacterium]|nr:imidazole glycerol phosphate synthase subunit HisH [Planctomycetota bacterium]